MPGRRSAGLLLAVCLALGLVSCAHRGPVLEPRDDLPPRVELSETPFFPQERYQCGPAALATVLGAEGSTVAPEALVSEVYLPSRKGSLQAEIIAAARKRGKLAVPVSPTLDGLLAEVAAGHPVLVLQNLGLDWLPRWHYAVAIGYDLERGTMVLRSGTEARRLTPFGVFLKTWNRSGRWGLVVLEPGALPARAEPASYLAAASTLETLGKRDAAEAAYVAATRRWPSHAAAWLALGNSRYARQALPEAEAAFRAAVGAQADAAPAWNNLAYALAGRGCVDAARAAARCATRLAPGEHEFADTLDDMEKRPAANGPACQAPPHCPAS